MKKIFLAANTGKSPQFITHADWSVLSFRIIGVKDGKSVVFIKGEEGPIVAWQARVAGVEIAPSEAQLLLGPDFIANRNRESLQMAAEAAALLLKTLSVQALYDPF